MCYRARISKVELYIWSREQGLTMTTSKPGSLSTLEGFICGAAAACTAVCAP